MKPTLQFYLVVVPVDQTGNPAPLTQSTPIGFTSNRILAEQLFNQIKNAAENGSTNESVARPEFLSPEYEAMKQYTIFLNQWKLLQNKPIEQPQSTSENLLDLEVSQ